MAQEKYNYATVSYSQSSKTVAVSINGTDFYKVTVSKGEVKHVLDLNPALKQVKKMNTEGWELINAGNVGTTHVYVFYLKRKEQ